ncbi:MAG: hypothetical protein HYR60_06130 [Acidobacteria bacterium]|nr:hypothetical protein [Acidobacteriota bacterium]
MAAIDATLDHQVVLHCIGGFAIAMLYDLPRPTVDVDCLSVIPVEETASLQSLAGGGSALHKEHGVYWRHVRIVTVPENYQDRLLPMFPDLSVLESRFQSELRPYLANTDRHDLTMRLWLEMLSGA